jgi:hypothetical protein
MALLYCYVLTSRTLSTGFIHVPVLLPASAANLDWLPFIYEIYFSKIFRCKVQGVLLVMPIEKGSNFSRLEL